MEKNDDNRLSHLERETSNHIVQCEERWKTNFARLASIEESLGRIEGRTIAYGGSAILFLATLVVTIMYKA